MEPKDRRGDSYKGLKESEVYTFESVERSCALKAGALTNSKQKSPFSREMGDLTFSKYYASIKTLPETFISLKIRERRNEMRVICAWCNRPMGEKEPYEDETISHGMCGKCKRKVDQEVKAFFDDLQQRIEDDKEDTVH